MKEIKYVEFETSPYALFFTEAEAEDGTRYIWTDYSPNEASVVELERTYTRICEELKEKGGSPKLLEIYPNYSCEQICEVSENTRLIPYPEHICFDSLESMQEAYKERVEALFEISGVRLDEVEGIARDITKFARVLMEVGNFISRKGRLGENKRIYVEPDYSWWEVCDNLHFAGEENVIAIKYNKNEKK